MTSNGHFEFFRTLFGLSTVPPVSQRYVNYVFRNLIRAGYFMPYMNNLIIVANSAGETMERLKIVLNTA